MLILVTAGFVSCGRGERARPVAGTSHSDRRPVSVLAFVRSPSVAEKRTHPVAFVRSSSVAERKGDRAGIVNFY